MPATARVRLTLRALRALRAQEEWLLERDALAPRRFARDVEAILTLLSEHPEAGRRIAGTSSRWFLTRHFRWRIVYRVHEGEVVVLDVLHPRQSGP